MKNLFSPFAKLVAIAACALTLGSCSRSEYAMLPKGGSYHGVSRVATPVPVAGPALNTSKVVAPEAVASENVVAPAAVAVAVPAQAANAVVTNAEAATIAATVALATTAPKMTRVQRFAATKLVKAVSKVSGASQFQQKHDTAKTQKISGNLRTGVILLLIGLLVSLFSGINGIFGLIGGIIAIIGLIFIILWLLDEL